MVSVMHAIRRHLIKVDVPNSFAYLNRHLCLSGMWKLIDVASRMHTKKNVQKRLRVQNMVIKNMIGSTYFI